jgi:lipoic acid synthetase
MILGNVCTRRCGFCNVLKGTPSVEDAGEPDRVAAAVKSLGLTYAVVTSVTRDDLPDGGAVLFAQTIRAIRKETPDCRVEVLIPDFQGSESSLMTVLGEGPSVLNHNLETVPSLYSRVRPQADYGRSIGLLKRAGKLGAITKSGIMLGLGERAPEVEQVMDDMRAADVDFITIGQYLRPTRDHLPMERYAEPAEFEALARSARAKGFLMVSSSPLTRSSYHADDDFQALAAARGSR